MARRPSVDTRTRSVRAHQTAHTKPTIIEWASPVQAEVFSQGSYPVCASGGFGSSKSYAFCLKALYLSDTYPNNRGVVGRKVWEELKHTTMATFYKICPAKAYEFGKRSDS